VMEEPRKVRDPALQLEKQTQNRPKDRHPCPKTKQPNTMEVASGLPVAPPGLEPGLF
jgi:hypothetical protein